MTRFLALASATVLLAACAASPQQRAPAAAPAADLGNSILWVGNSFCYYNNSMHGHVRSLAQAISPRVNVRGTSLTVSGSGIDWHDVESYLAPGRLGRYSFVGDNEIRFNPPGPQYGAVILMDCSQCPVHPQLSPVFHEYARKHSETIRRHGARPVLFMSWAYKDKPEMTAQLAEQYVKAGKANDAQVIPAGLAFAKAIAKRPGIELYAPDKRHPSLAGTYLAAATVFGAMTRQSPVPSTYTGGLDAELARFLRETAWETVQEFSRQ